MTEELIAQLSKIGRLSVIARTSILKYRDTDMGIDDIGRELGVGTILEGSVRKAGDEVRITAQLIDVASQAHLWSEKYDRRFAGIFAIQSDIAEQVAEALQITLLEGERQQIDDRGTRDAEVYALYLQGLYFYNRSTEEGTRKARRYFEQAIEKDPAFPQAYVKLSDLHSRAVWQDYASPEEGRARARDAVNKALALDASLADAHAALADIQINVDWNWNGAENSLRRAIDLNPSYARAHMLLGHYLFTAVRRQYDEGIGEMMRAVELDPWTPINQENLGWAYYHAERYNEALGQFKKAREMFPHAPFNYVGLCQSMAMQGSAEEAIAQIEYGVEIAPDNPWLLGFLAWTYGIARKLDRAQAVIESLEGHAATMTVPAMAMAWAFAGVGDKDRALDWMEKAYDERGDAIVYLQAPEFRHVLYDEPRYQALLKRVRLGPEA
jgi:tetratricopeptide (TPR) repeat protein